MSTSTRVGRSIATGSGHLGRGSAVLAVLTVQVIAFAAAYVAEQPTLYALFAMGSAAAIAGATGGGLRGVAAAAVATGVVGAIGWALESYWILVVGPVIFTLVVGTTERRWAGVAAATMGSVLLVALALPLALFVARQDPGLVSEALRSPEVHRMLYLTVYGPLLATLFTLVFGVPLAYLLARGFPGRPLVEGLVDLPLVVPHSVAGLLILFGFGRGAAFPELGVLGTTVGMVLAMAFVSAPFAVNVAREAFEDVERDVERAARVHGASQFEAFRRVSLPLAARGVLTGGVLAWARAVSEFGAVAVVAYNVSFFYPPAGEVVTGQHAPVFIFNTFTAGSLAESSAVAFVLLSMSLGIFLLVRWLAYDASTAGVIR
ncbi:ABC transporter permease [Halomarina pelagica]|uniref:ABC transporter permease n=1 Tax=Halomarina pelagica TaxID=2961599 RepID=UPI0020C50B24|nr:ABC transporter permease [Halomarina sp. BND7]